MKKNKLVHILSYLKIGKNGYDFDNTLDNMCTKDEIKEMTEKYSSPEYLTEVKLLSWKELDNCNFIEKIIYKMNIPAWILNFIYAIILMFIGAWLSSLF